VIQRLHPLWIIAGTLLFGLLTFLAGLVVGLSLTQKTSETNPVAALSGVVPAAALAAAPPNPATVVAQSGEAAASPVPAPAAVPKAPVAPDGPMVKGLRSGSVTDMPGGQLGPLAMRALAAQEPGEAPLSNRVISVEVGRFLLADAAADLVGELKRKGFNAEAVTASFPGMPPWHIVILGPQPDESTAHQLAIDASRATGLAARVVSWPKPAS
jgi:cell division septation protein DedD